MRIFKKNKKTKGSNVYMLHYLQKLKEAFPVPLAETDYEVDEMPEELKEKWKTKNITSHYFATYPDYNEWVISFKNKNHQQKIYYLISDEKNKDILKAYDMTSFFQQTRDSFQYSQEKYVSLDMIIGVVGGMFENFHDDFRL